VATQREIKKRIVSVSSTKKITKTMEMVSTSKMKKMQDRLLKTQPYSQKIDTMIAHIQETAVDDLYDPLLLERPNPSRVMLISITGNRGLCGGYNTNVIDETIKFKKKLSIEEGKEVLLYVMGKKGINYFKFAKETMYKSMPNPEDKISFADAVAFGEELINQFVSGEVDEVYVAYTRIVSSASQKPAIIRLLPISTEQHEIIDKGSEFKRDYVFEPNPYEVLSSLLPLYVKVKLYTCILESGFSEQFARRVAMKNATDAATDMVRELTIKYNRVRQAKITNEIAEIVGGASALV
jgi:F-type H+-transporting ATPase subunit gamma